MLKYDLPEKRKEYRVYLHIPVICEIANSKDKPPTEKAACLNNISLDGMYFDIDEMLPFNSELNVKFQLPNSGNIITAIVRVKRVLITEKEGIYGIGTSFASLTSESREEIKQLVKRLSINRILDLAVQKQASDLHLVTDQPPILRIQGELKIQEDLPKLDTEDITNLVYGLMTRRQIERFAQEKELDFGIQYDASTRFRINVHQQKGFLEATFRLITAKLSSFEELKLPEAVKGLARQKDGLVLISGPAGSGKSTTIAAMVELINRERTGVIITLERPIEYVYSNIKSIIKQREVGVDTGSFSTALKSSLRQDPNVIVVGELEDIETIKTALLAAEAGYLVIASFHAPNTVQALDRLVSIFPVDNRKQILSQLANCIQGVITQLLIPGKDKKERVLATEIVIANDAVRKVIRNDELIQLPTIIQSGGSASMMQSMYDSIMRYLDAGIVDEEAALFYSKEFNTRKH